MGDPHASGADSMGRQGACLRLARRGAGFSLIELITVIVLVGILAAIAAPSVAGVGRLREIGAARSILKDLTYARQRATATDVVTWVRFGGTSRWEVLAEDVQNPGLGGAQALPDLGTDGTMTRVLGQGESIGVSLTLVDFDSTTSVGFDGLGRPLNGNETMLAGEGRVEVTGGHAVRLAPGAGLAWLELGP